MRSLKLTLAYDGTDYCGWQVQSAGHTIQAAVESAWHSVTDERVRITASGRTDAGVHAIGQVASLETEASLHSDVLLRALNANLPPDIRVIAVDEVAHGFHAIRDARFKRYRYVIQDIGLQNIFLRHYAWYRRRPLDLAKMQQAAKLLVGKHDFASFQAAGSPRATTVRNLTDLSVRRRGDIFSVAEQPLNLLTIEVEADGFLYNMVRNIVGTLVEIGQGKPPDWVSDVLAAHDRTVAGPTAPARGLYLINVTYGY